MLSSKTLKTFVKMHEYKLNAKINGLKAERLEDQVINDLHHNTHSMSGSAEHWHLSESDVARKRPQSHYFDFILTSTH